MKIPQPDLGQEFVAKAFGKAILSVCDKGEFGKSCYSQEKKPDMYRSVFCTAPELRAKAIPHSLH